MNRPRTTWVVFLLFLAVVMGAMGWVSVTVLRLEADSVRAQREAHREEAVRLALWRLDAAAMALVIEESSRPYQDYWAFNDGARPLEALPGGGQQVAASPLLTHTGGNVNVYFNGLVTTDQTAQVIASPQVPPAGFEAWAVENFALDELLQPNSENLLALNDRMAMTDLQNALRENPSRVRDRSLTVPPSTQQQALFNTREFASRQSQNVAAQQRMQGQKQAQYAALGGPTVLEEGIMRSVWVNDLLILGRHVKVGERHYIQGAWLDWVRVKADLLASVRDILPHADLLPVFPSDAADPSRTLAVLPARLLPGLPATAPALIAAPLKVPLALAWVGLLISVAAVAALLFGAVRLSERRGAFVSAVTHELRTPLTTFRMYTEMLAEGMVTDEARRQEYHATLHRESNRLGHLVENVLAYAGLERGQGSRLLESVTVGVVLERCRDALARRAAEAGMELAIEEGADISGLVIRSDQMAVGQILFNLVDNACKYAAAAEDRRIHLALTREAGRLVMRVCDHGPGLKSGETRLVFKAFRKSATRAARSAPGVGLGLALCRSLARQLGGEVCYERRAGYGACFVLRLPLGATTA